MLSENNSSGVIKGYTSVGLSVSFLVLSHLGSDIISYNYELVRYLNCKPLYLLMRTCKANGGQSITGITELHSQREGVCVGGGSHHLSVFQS